MNTKPQLGEIVLAVLCISVIMFIICFTDFIINYFTM